MLAPAAGKAISRGNCRMYAAHYRFSAMLAASLSSSLVACSLQPLSYPLTQAGAPASQVIALPTEATAPSSLRETSLAQGSAPAAGSGSSTESTGNIKTASNKPDDIETESTIWTVLGLAKKPSAHPP